MKTMTNTLQRTVSVNYHNLPDYLRKEGVALAKQELGLTLTDLMKGRAEFGLSAKDPATERRAIVDVIHTTTP